ncbi:MAG: GWxTD domain-containing protein [candidate division WOR-3 bacterium]
MILIFFFLASIKWQVSYVPTSDSSCTMNLLLEIPSQQLKFIVKDSLYMASYEIQLLVFDNKGNQIAGDYWFREREEDSTNFYDSLSLIIPNSARKFNLRIIDLAGTEILNVYESIKPINFFANIHSRTTTDSLVVSFTVINPKNIRGEVTVYLQEMKQSKTLRAGIYEDTIIFMITQLTVGRYELKFVLTEKSKRIDAISVPVVIERPFYLDETVWHLKVSQLEYIATPNEVAILKKAEVGKRDSLWKVFWKQYDPTPNTEYNEKEREYFERIDYAQEHFSFGDKGWRSDRGRIYVKYGPPDEIQSRPYELSSKPYEIWLYYRLNLKFIFYDRHGFGEYLLISPQGERI